MRIQNNPMAINAYNNLQGTQMAQGKSLERLSSGFRINRASDDAAGLVISENLRSQVGGLKVAKRNAQDAVSLVQTAEGALTEVHSMLQRMRDLSVQSANDTNNAKGRQAIAAEIGELKSQVRNVLVGTEFNGRKLFVNQDRSPEINATSRNAAAAALSTTAAKLTGAKGAGDLQLLTNDGDTANTVPKKFEVVVFQDGIEGADFTAVEADNEALAKQHFAKLTGQKDLVIAADGNNVQKGDLFIKKAGQGDTATFTLTLKNETGNGKEAAITDYTFRSDLEAISEARDGDTVGLMSSVASPKENIKFQVGANNAQTDSLSIATSDIDLFKSVVNKLDPAALDVSTNVKARQSVDDIDKLIDSVSEVRGKLGATQNRLDHTVNSIKVSVENLTASESRIRDTDMAEEMMSLTRAQILNQAGTAMLSQANQVPQGVLSLLR